MSVYNRRLPVYLVLDCSESQAGEPIEAIASGVAALLADLRGDPMAMETVYLSVLTFASKAETVVPLTELMKFQVPKLRMGSGTALGAALKLLAGNLERDVVKSSAVQKGDWKPVVLILTDGEPTDDWQAAADAVRTTVCGTKANVIAIACGPDAAAETLHRITPTVLKAADLQPGTLRALFKWVSASVSVASARLEGTPAGGAVGLPPLPTGALEVAPTGGPPPAPNRFVFLHARCGKSKQFYLIRYEKRKKAYDAVATHRVDDFDHAGAAAGLGISVDLLGPPPDCPCCGNPGLSACDCRKVFCSPPITRGTTLTCPWCGTAGRYAPSTGGFEVGRGAG